MEILNNNLAQSDTDEIDYSFWDMGLKEDILKGIFAVGLENPSAVQQRAIKVISRGSDIMIQSWSGSGKSTAFIIGMLQSINLDTNELQAIILEPTREMAKALYTQIVKIGEYLNVKAHAIFGGINFAESKRVLRNSIHVIVGTPGRTHDYIKKGVISAARIKIFIIDEADEILGRGFKDQVLEIFQFLPKNFQVCFSSSTMPVDVSEMVEIFMKNPVRIKLIAKELTLEGVKQYYIQAEGEAKLSILLDLLDSIEICQVIIFCHKKETVEALVQAFQGNKSFSNYSVSFIHNDMNLNQQEKAMRDFRTGSTRILIVTDLTRRLIDLHQSFIIHYDFPLNYENYITRVGGKSGIYGRKVLSIGFINQSEFQFLKDLESHFSTIIEELPNDISNLL
ncbi:unnamed protein product [Blepharisma stoltei]|uniref:ATP-dependent RNA helicase n=1 Tax=Blepharisma stoltei TaxID=1481888 RepID=A0AAU9IAE0_9CILI|nr:unnamed protein product [Blepharisma stoltei]